MERDNRSVSPPCASSRFHCNPAERNSPVNKRILLAQTMISCDVISAPRTENRKPAAVGHWKELFTVLFSYFDLPLIQKTWSSLFHYAHNKVIVNPHSFN